LEEAASPKSNKGSGAPLEPLLRKLAFIGGGVLFVMSALVITNVTLRGLADTSVTGVFDLVKIGAAMCVFLFLPLCQAKRGNIFVDSFTSSLPLRIRNGLDALWDVVYAALALFMCAAMLQGAREQFSTHVQTTQLAIPIWPFNLAAALLLGLLGVVSLITAARIWRGGTFR
jgi:TRAP-type C4-dicarboxylate transport system permease small subunit